MITLTMIAQNLHRFKPMAMSFAHNTMLVDDILQDTFIKISNMYEKTGSLEFINYNDKINESYMYLIIRSCYYDIVRKEKKYSDSPVVNVAAQPIEPNMIEMYLNGLSWYEKRLTEVYFNEEHSVRSLAKATKISPTNIYLTLKKTKDMIEEQLNQEVKNEIAQYVKEKVKAKSKPKSKGVGDTVEKVLHSKPLKPITEAIKNAIWKDNEDCGCDKRKEFLNKMFPYKHPNCMTEEQYNLWSETVKKFEANTIKNEQLKVVAQLHSRLFNHKYQEPCRCDPKTWARWIRDIETIYNTYKDENNGK